ncbi:PREDICTED: protein trichome birefringence-like 3 [Camelina sativa]|uniref:Protein trichome birefringence-like 3 n=1 Tax=Camelina sativa TaxID=90675 RepID=A0ABM0V762_CAMSA|nr:PREDICTED: protein trichome birefringence-like 3 [Camelina sativa]
MSFLILNRGAGGTKIPLSIIVLVLCGFMFFVLLYTERISLMSSSSSSSSSYLFKLKSCPRKEVSSKPKDKIRKERSEILELLDDRFEFDPEECNVASGKWVYNSSIEPLYTDRSCPYIDRQFSCMKNGQQETDYLRWEWQPDDCTIPRFSPKLAMNKLRGKRLLFVGDSLQRSQWESFVCSVESIIPEGEKSMNRSKRYFVFKAKEYNATIEFYWAPYIVESNTDIPVILDPKKRIVKVDSVEDRAKFWEGADILVFNTYVWWMSGIRMNALWGSFGNGASGAEALDTAVAYRLGLKTWANWVDSTVDPNKTRVFFTTMSPTHTRSADWGKPNGTKCFNETKPVKDKKFWGTGSNKQMMKVVSNVIKHMATHVTVINITQLSEYRIDAHTSVYTETGGKILTAEERADPMRHADCIHWCLPGLPDTWNRILLANLL